MSKHTPGPWKCRVILKKYSIGLKPKLTGIVANGPISKIGGIENGAKFIAYSLSPGDARLIAAAPEMIEALKTVTLWMQNCDLGGDLKPWLKSLIAKAEGKKS